MAGLLMGFAIVSMHYVGMGAMRMQPPIDYRLALVALSIAIAIAASLIALWCAFKQRAQTIVSAFWNRAGSAVVMGLAIVGMHYTGMAAAKFDPNSVCTVRSSIPMRGLCKKPRTSVYRRGCPKCSNTHTSQDQERKFSCTQSPASRAR